VRTQHYMKYYLSKVHDLLSDKTQKNMLKKFFWGYMKRWTFFSELWYVFSRSERQRNRVSSKTCLLHNV